MPPAHFAVVAPGLEAMARAELQRHGFARVSQTEGGAYFDGSALRANRCLALPGRVLTRVTRFHAATFQALIDGAAAVDWTPYGGLTPRVSSQRSRLYHSDAVAERLAAVVPPGPVTLHVRLNRDRCDLSVDTSGENLHRRGWRLDGGPAPLRETLAAGVLALAGWAPGTPLHDPMCGSGTLLIEAATQAAGLAPGRLRGFACEAWLPPEPIPTGPATPTRITGGDRDAHAVDRAQANAGRAGIDLTLAVQPAAAARPADPAGLLVCNPPYDHRLRDARDAMAQLGALLAGPFEGWRAAILCGDPLLAGQLQRPVRASHRLRNGGHPVELLLL